MSFITPKQLKIVQTARSQVNKRSGGQLDDSQWRLILRNVGHVPPDDLGHVSSKKLDQVGFELVMRFLEERGYREPGRAADHWRTRPGGRDDRASTRQLHEITQLAVGGKYPLASMVRRITKGKHDQPEQLTGAQAFKLIEALKAISKRVRKEVDEHAELNGSDNLTQFAGRAV